MGIPAAVGAQRGSPPLFWCGASGVPCDCSKDGSRSCCSPSKRALRESPSAVVERRLPALACISVFLALSTLVRQALFPGSASSWQAHSGRVCSAVPAFVLCPRCFRRTIFELLIPGAADPASAGCSSTTLNSRFLDFVFIGLPLIPENSNSSPSLY